MNKDDAITFLKKKGYAVENDRGVVTIITNRVISKKEYGELLKILREHDYNASFGIKPAITGQVIETLTSTATVEEIDENLEDFDSDEDDEAIVSDEQLSFFENGNGQLSFL